MNGHNNNNNNNFRGRRLELKLKHRSLDILTFSDLAYQLFDGD